jgi:GNAT superfamily N-acetyltransferase
VLRRARPEDAEEVAEVFLAARVGMEYLPRLHSDEATRTYFAGVVRERETWVAEANGAVAGVAALADDELEHLYVRPESHGQGIGTLLPEQAKRRRPEGFRFWLFQQNEGAQRFYKRRGCRLIELTEGAGNEERVPDALYEWLPDTARRERRALPGRPVRVRRGRA